MNRDESNTPTPSSNLKRMGDHTLLDPSVPLIDLYSAAGQRLDKIHAVSVAFMETAHRDNGALSGGDLYNLGALFYDLARECHAILDVIEEAHGTQ